MSYCDSHWCEPPSDEARNIGAVWACGECGKRWTTVPAAESP